MLYVTAVTTAPIAHSRSPSSMLLSPGVLTRAPSPRKCVVDLARKVQPGVARRGEELRSVYSTGARVWVRIPRHAISRFATIACGRRDSRATTSPHSAHGIHAVGALPEAGKSCILQCNNYKKSHGKRLWSRRKRGSMAHARTLTAPRGLAAPKHAPAKTAKSAKAATPGFWSRLYKAMTEAQMRRAEREIAAYLRRG